MDFSERLGWLLLGCLIGFTIGYIVRSLREIKGEVITIKEEVDEIDEIVKEKRTMHRADDDGFMRFPIVRDVVILVVVVATVMSAFWAQRASNDSDKANERLGRVTVCTSEFLSRTIRALNFRTEAVQNRADANLELQKAQAKFFTFLLHIPPYTETERRTAAEDYLDALTNFVEVNTETNLNSEQFPYPTNEELNACLDRTQTGEKP